MTPTPPPRGAGSGWPSDGTMRVLDGGLATELEARGHDLRGSLWSARLLLDDPDAIVEAHRRFLRAGAECIVTATYQATVPGLLDRGCSVTEAEATLVRGTELALRAVELEADRTGVVPSGAGTGRPAPAFARPRPLVAASVGPYGAFLADGSEYRGRYGVDRDTLVSFHRGRWAVLASSGPDLLACETIPSAIEAEVLADLARGRPGPPVWISFTCRDGERLRDGTPIERAIERCGPSDGVCAFGVNCTAPDHVPELVRRIRDATDLPVLAYPNSGERYDARSGAWSGSVDGDHDRSRWIRSLLRARTEGAVGLGGCCRIGPEDIAALSARLAAAGEAR